MKLVDDLFLVGGSFAGLTHRTLNDLFDDGNTYVVASGKSLVLIDCGNGETFDQIVSRMLYWGLDPDDISHCFLTHPHWDHAGGAHKVRNRGIRVVAGGDTADAVFRGDERCCGYLYHSEFIPCEVDAVIEDGQKMEVGGLEIEALAFPGHTSGCTAYRLPMGSTSILFSGDIIGTPGFGFSGWNGSIDFDKPRYIDSLKRLARLSFDVMLPGHGMPYFHKPRIRVEECLNEALMQWR